MIKTPFFNWLVENRQVYGRKINPSLIKKFVSMLEYEDHEERYHMILKRSYEVDIEPNLLYANNRYFDLRLYDISHYLPSDILVKVDRAAMFNSLETRSPFLNKRIADLAFSNFHNSLIDNNYQKGVLKAILLDYFPEEFFNRKKAGFSLPIGQWVRSDWKEYFFDVYNSKSQIDDFIIKRCQTDLEREVLNKNDHNIYKVWDIFIFKQWESFYN